ncbi:heme ABC transporter ATP-binding protein [Zavarzinia compransoris]|uniref:heme ABC transporter ATP-binding protein n=1 Tax=Zavarzinia marina TaxID=2911065 RepID=UPI001F305099|nr:heme ABC transporter ATP-binding protein [Zavarzinia marina]MCF4165857.1 heme ABC transporter ATP-binding protein [Zavarzinia marina]
MLAARELSLILPSGRRILDRASLSVAPGQLTAVIGPNGAGKSSLLRLLAGEARPAEGRADLDETPLARLRGRERARRIAVLPQSTHLDFAFRVSEVVGLGRLPHGDDETRGRGRAVVAAALAQVDLADYGDRLYTTLSGGEQQRVQLARCLAQLDLLAGERPDRARYLLLDEPTASLDPAHQLAVMTLARDLSRRGLGVLAVLHDLGLAASVCDRLVVMAGGRIVADGPPGATLDRGLIAAVYGIDAEVIANPVGGGVLIAPRAARCP